MAVVKHTFVSSLVILAVGVLFVVVGFYLHGTQTAYPDGTAATATLSSIDTGRDDDGKLIYTAVYTFTTADGAAVTFRDQMSSGSRPTIGSTAPISYRATDPEGARVVRGWNFFALATVGMGLLVALFGLRGVLARLLRLFFLVGAWRTQRTTG